MEVTESMITAYLNTALWSSTEIDQDGEDYCLDSRYSVDECSFEVKDKARKDIEVFLSSIGDSLLEDALCFADIDTIMHDFWLTRNHHGAGFWDGDYDLIYSNSLENRKVNQNAGKNLGDLLTEYAHTLGELNLYVGDDNKIYCM